MWERVYRQWKGKGVEFVGVGLLDSKENSRQFVVRHRLSFPNGYDGTGRIARAYGFFRQPYWAVIAKDGTLLAAGMGPRDEAELVSTVRSLAGR